MPFVSRNLVAVLGRGALLIVLAFIGRNQGDGEPSLPLRAAAVAPDDTPQGFEEHAIRGFRVLVHESMRQHESDRLDQALGLLSCQLHDVQRKVPPTALAHLRKVKIWFDPHDRHHPCAVYHPAAAWLREHGYDEAKEDSVHVTNLECFLSWTHHQPAMILHELAHAYHDQVLGFDHADLIEAHRRAKASGDYDEVLHAGGRARRHYALTDPKEFFAELTESLFSTNDFYPFVRAELQQHDAQSLAMVEGLWNIDR